MKKIIFLFGFLLIFVLGYLLGSFYPISGFSFFGQGVSSIAGDAVLQVILSQPDGTAVANVEVDLSDKVGPPATGGVVLTDAVGIATFHVKPGTYFVFFNTNNFPESFQVPREQQTEVKESETNQVKIHLNLK